jgi:hypothetical protein
LNFTPGSSLGGTTGSFNGYNGGGFDGFNPFTQANAFGMMNPFAQPGNRYQNGRSKENSAINNRLTYEELQERRNALAQAKNEAREVGATVAMNFKEGIHSVATAEEVGDYFHYLIDQRITLSRQKSAMLPILDRTIEGAKVSIYSPDVHAKHPLLGLRLKNTSGQPLTQGPITVYDNATYAGDTRILDLQPNEERLLSYALDQATEVKSEVKSAPSPEMTLTMDSSHLTARYRHRETKTYTIRNRGTHDRLMVIEHAIRDGWSLVDGLKPREKTRSVYRFEIKAPANQTVALQVAEENVREDTRDLKGQPSYASTAGIEVKTVTTCAVPKLLKLTAHKGVLTPTLRLRETKSFFVQNLSDMDREFTVDHIIRPEWTLLSEKGDPVKGPAVHRFHLSVKKGKTGEHHLTEESIHEARAYGVKEISDAQLRDYLAEPVVHAMLKAGLSKLLDLNAKYVETNKQLAEFERQLKAISVDQERLRYNMQVIPQTAEPYKRFLDKFVAQETEIETLQRQVRQTQAALTAVQREHDAFIASWTVE